jgi:hypothetical protein
MRLGRADPRVTPTLGDVAYAAGFFDGEGHITIAKMEHKAGTNGTTFTMRVGASQNNPVPLLWLRERWGGSVRMLKRKTGRDHSTHKWELCSKMAAGFLREVLPYLLVKWPRAELAVRFQESLFVPGKHGHTDEYRARLEAMRLEMAAMQTHKPFSGAPQ